MGAENHTSRMFRLSVAGFKLMLANTEVEVEEEHYIYDFTSFVSECGGSLGLFLGFSFLMTLDYITPLLITLQKSVKKHV